MKKTIKQQPSHEKTQKIKIISVSEIATLSAKAFHSGTELILFLLKTISFPTILWRNLIFPSSFDHHPLKTLRFLSAGPEIDPIFAIHFFHGV